MPIEAFIEMEYNKYIEYIVLFELNSEVDRRTIMKKYLRSSDCDYEELKRIEASESIEIDLDNYDMENDPEGIFDIDNADDDTCYSFDSYDEYKKFIKIFDER